MSAVVRINARGRLYKSFADVLANPQVREWITRKPSKYRVRIKEPK